MSKRIGFMFAGQGAQSPGMGASLPAKSKAAAEVFARADALLGRPISKLCFEGDALALTASANCQPAIYTVSVACMEAFREQSGIDPVICGGLSLGEFAALHASGATDFETGLNLVSQRGKLMDEACQQTNGAMAAVIGAELDVVKQICDQAGIDVANLNCPGQIVISGDAERVKQAIQMLAEAGIERVISLNVAGAFHSRLMTPAAKAFSGVLGQTEFSAPDIPFVQNVTGETVNSPEAIRTNLEAQVDGSVLWEKCVRTMLAQEICALIEFGPGKVLSGFMKRIDRRFPVCNVSEATDLDRVADFLKQL